MTVKKVLFPNIELLLVVLPLLMFAGVMGFYCMGLFVIFLFSFIIVFAEVFVVVVRLFERVGSL